MADIEIQKQQSIEKEVTKKGKTKKNKIKQKCQDCGKAFFRIDIFLSARQKIVNCRIYD